MKQLKTYNFKQVDLSTKEPIINIVTINECVAIETINEILPAGEKLVNKGDIDWLLKIKAKKELFISNTGKPFRHKDNNYYFWISTPSDARKETALFVREDILPIIREYENVVSQGWLSEQLLNQEVSVNKDILRISLHLSSAYRTNIKPDLLIVPEVEYITNQLVRTLENDKLIEEFKDITSVAFDGMGIMSLETAKAIQNELEINHKVTFAGMRIGTLACKGLLVSIDFMKYFKELHKEIGDTDFLKMIDGKIYILDVYGEPQEVTSNTLILPTSCVKWWKNFSSLEDVKARTNSKYDVVNNLFITKVNKSPLKLDNENKKTSYQLLTQLALTHNEYNELTAPTYDLLSKLLKPAKEGSDICDQITMENKEVVLQYLNVFGDDEEVNLSSKIGTLLSADYKKYSKEPFVRKTLANSIEKTVKELGSGKVYVEGAHFKTLASDPLALLRFTATRVLQPTLGAKDFWCNSNEQQILCARFPIAMFSEIQKMNLVENDLYKKYCSHWTKELLVFNIQDITAQLLSGADFDTDTAYCATNKILINSIIPPKNNIPFLPTIAGATKKVPYSLYNREIENYNAFGNLIGKIALLSTSISNVAQDIGVIVNGIHYGKNESYQMFLNGRSSTQVSATEKNEFWNKYNNYQQARFLNNEEVKNIIANRFYALEPVLAKIVTESMVAIDMPKTSIAPDLDAIKQISKNFSYPYFFHLLPDREYNKYSLDNISNSLLSFYGWVTENNLLKWTMNAQTSIKNNKSIALMELSQAVNTLPADQMKVQEIYTILDVAFKEFEKLKKDKDKKVEVVKKERDFTGKIVAGATTERVYYLNEDARENIKNHMYKQAEKTACKVYTNYEPIEIAQAVSTFLSTTSYVKQKYILDFYFTTVELYLNNSYETLEIVEKSPEGKVALFDKYVAKRVPNVNHKKLTVDGSVGQKELQQFQKKLVPTQQFKLGVMKENAVAFDESLLLE